MYQRKWACNTEILIRAPDILVNIVISFPLLSQRCDVCGLACGLWWCRGDAAFKDNIHILDLAPKQLWIGVFGFKQDIQITDWSMEEKLSNYDRKTDRPT